ncbi:MAG TPA: glycoside hydrolase family 2 TIM barrel-domain containing protein, partial [Tepidisphaeraceae bacterium]|nr:glycoside hydrolase family 2 TIM barrel-domain containing protein [Tepidisphaeraceae bacterium]
GLADPGIDDYRNEFLWHPDHPNLIDAELELRDEKGETIDRAVSYCAMRHIGALSNRIVLNGKPYPLVFVLNQGYWPESGLTAPDDEALRQDVELIRAMGFNGVRLHQKIEDPRFLYWADRLGLLVWEEMPSPYRFSLCSIQRMTQQWIEAIERDCSHPCVMAWVPFNESWGVPDLPHDTAQRDAVQALYHLTRTIDPTRPVIGNDGWEAGDTDIVAIHDYDADPRRLARRYSVAGEQSSVQHLLSTERPGNKLLILNGFTYRGQPIMLTEFGGIAFSKEHDRTWGYSRAQNADDFASRYAHLLAVVRSLPLLSGFCYTQFTDTYQEANGLLFMDRTPKFPIEQIAAATRGAWSDSDRRSVAKWRHLTQRRLSEIDRAKMADVNTNGAE